MTLPRRARPGESCDAEARSTGATKQAARWLQAAGRAEDYIAARCMNSAGVYAAFEGSEAADVPTILLPEWGDCAGVRAQSNGVVFALVVGVLLLMARCH